MAEKQINAKNIEKLLDPYVVAIWPNSMIYMSKIPYAKDAKCHDEHDFIHRLFQK